MKRNLKDLGMIREYNIWKKSVVIPLIGKKVKIIEGGFFRGDIGTIKKVVRVSGKKHYMIAFPTFAWHVPFFEEEFKLIK